MREGVLLVIVGPSGTGKTTLANLLLESDSDLKLSVSMTTRAPRPGEEDGDEYSFVSREKFEHLIEEEAFLEYAEVYGDLYGTSKAWVSERLARGDDVLVVLDIQGGKAVKKWGGKAACAILIAPPDLDMLANRLKARGTEKPDQVRKRLIAAPNEIKAGIEFCDYLLLNKEIPAALFDLIAILRTQRLSRVDREAFYNQIV